MWHQATVERQQGIPFGGDPQAGGVLIFGAPAGQELEEAAGKPSQVAPGATGLDQLSSAARRVQWSDVRAVILHLPQGHTFTNRLYRVHPRRNDRFIAASDTLIACYPSVDFANIHYTGHLMRELWQTDPQRFSMVRRQLREAWHARMERLIGMIDAPTIIAAQNMPDDQARWLPIDPSEEVERLSHLVDTKVMIKPQVTCAADIYEEAATQISRAIKATE